MIFNENSSMIDSSGDVTPEIDVTKSVTVKAIAGGTIANNRPVSLYLDENGNLKCLLLTANADTPLSQNPGYYGVVHSGGSAGDILEVIIQGKATLASGGTAGNFVTAISNGGVITDASEGNGQGYLGVSLTDKNIYIY